MVSEIDLYLQIREKNLNFIKKWKMRYAMKKIKILFLTFFVPTLLFAQEKRLPPTDLVDLPTAGTIDRGSYVSSLRIYPNGGLLGTLKVGLSNRFYL
jgi:hypothetical protein